MQKRYQTACAPGHNCTDDEINGLIEESNTVTNDDNVRKYESPSKEEMEDIIAVAETYDGEWYHAAVVLNETYLETASYEERKLAERIKILGAEHGLYLSYLYEDPELEAALKALFEK